MQVSEDNDAGLAPSISASILLCKRSLQSLQFFSFFSHPCDVRPLRNEDGIVECHHRRRPIATHSPIHHRPLLLASIFSAVPCRTSQGGRAGGQIGGRAAARVGGTYCHTAPSSLPHTPHSLRSDGCPDCGHIVRTKREPRDGSVLYRRGKKKEKGQLMLWQNSWSVGTGCHHK